MLHQSYYQDKQIIDLGLVERRRWPGFSFDAVMLGINTGFATGGLFVINVTVAL